MSNASYSPLKLIEDLLVSAFHSWIARAYAVLTGLLLFAGWYFHSLWFEIPGLALIAFAFIFVCLAFWVYASVHQRHYAHH